MQENKNIYHSEIDKMLESIAQTVGQHHKSCAAKILRSACDQKILNVGMRSGHEFATTSCKVSDIHFLSGEEQTVVNTLDQIEEFLPNEDNYYFASEEVLRFNEDDEFLGIVGNSWFKNDLDDEFAESLIFCSHQVKIVDCVIGSICVNRAFKSEKDYLIPGSVVILKRVEFKHTKYLEINEYLTRVCFQNEMHMPWTLGNEFCRYYWKNGLYRLKYHYDTYDDDDIY